ncbi:MAG: Na+/H+ antiporter NhaC family protein [Halanaerobium sp.]|nr:Na+/H+ antiporter NhaC family protein [Halanaerobium sp.]
MQKKDLPERRLTFLQALITVMTMAIFILLAVLAWDLPIHLALFFELVVTSSLAFYWGYSWAEIEEMLFASFQNIGSLISILLMVGMLIGIWMEGGTIPSLIYYGIKLIDPEYFLVLVFLLVTIVSMAVGTAVGTASVIGLALISVARGLNFPLPLVAGAIISGSYIGDRMSPVAPIANMLAFSSGLDINRMFKEMLPSISLPYLLTLIAYLLAGLFFLPGGASLTPAGDLLQGLVTNFTITPFLLLPPLLIIVLAFLRLPTIPNLAISVILSLGLGVVLGGRDGISLLLSMYSGFQGATDIALLNQILARGGLLNMLDLIAMIILAVLLGGLFEELGVLQSILGRLIQGIKTKSQLMLTTMLSSMITAMVSCNLLLSVYLPGRMMAAKYDQLKVPRKDLARALGDSGLIISPLIPWNINGLMMTGILGISTLQYLPFSFLQFFLPLATTFYALVSNRSRDENTGEISS